MPGTHTTGRQTIDADRNVWYEYNRGSGKVELVVNGQQVMAVGANEVVASGQPIPAIAPPEGGGTVDAEARAAINAILALLTQFKMQQQS